MDEPKHGGSREGAGRKPKADEIALIETMDALLAPVEVWEALAEKVKLNDLNAIKLWVAYRFGMPKQTVDHSGHLITSEKILSPQEAKELLEQLTTK